MSTSCICCNKPLSVPESQIRGMGPICAAKKAVEYASSESTDKVDLPFDPVTKDILVERREDGLHFNIYQIIHYHSPTGFEIGYGGSGPADFALNILELFMRERGERPNLPLRNFNIQNGDRQHPTNIKICEQSWHLHHDFKFKFIAAMDRNGGIVKGDDIRRWLDEKMTQDKWSLAA